MILRKHEILIIIFNTKVMLKHKLRIIILIFDRLYNYVDDIAYNSTKAIIYKYFCVRWNRIYPSWNFSKRLYKSNITYDNSLRGFE